MFGSDAILNYMKKLIASLVVVLIVLTGSGLVAQNYQRDGLELNSTKPCEKAQIYVEKKLRDNDLKGRVNRLQIYEYIYTNADAFVARLENNNQPNARNMRMTLNQLRTKIDQFENRYEEYDQLRDAIQAVGNCDQNSKKFNQSVLEARVARIRLYSLIEEIDNIIYEKFSAGLNEIYDELLRTGSSQELQQ